MLNKIIMVILKVFGWIVSFIVHLIFLPLFNLLYAIFPNLSSYFQNTSNWIENNLFDGIAFLREVFFNVTHFNRDIISAIITYLLLYYAFAIGQRAFIFIMNIWRAIRKGE